MWCSGYNAETCLIWSLQTKYLLYPILKKYLKNELLSLFYSEKIIKSLIVSYIQDSSRRPIHILSKLIHATFYSYMSITSDWGIIFLIKILIKNHLFSDKTAFFTSFIGIKDSYFNVSLYTFHIGFNFWHCEKYI